MRCALSICHASDTGKVEESIKQGGLAEIKTQRIKTILATVLEERGKICMEYLREMSDECIKTELSRSYASYGMQSFCRSYAWPSASPTDHHVRHMPSLGAGSKAWGKRQ
jgi:endonuclease-3